MSVHRSHETKKVLPYPENHLKPLKTTYTEVPKQNLKRIMVRDQMCGVSVDALIALIAVVISNSYCVIFGPLLAPNAMLNFIKIGQKTQIRNFQYWLVGLVGWTSLVT